ncbi:MAG TPA: bifunctional pyr operon transcriptional regulator/uracil phosphoribosyltransferase PyrR, partial [Flavipsychrobacter sp.]|nr:bifunctional pyr operon transcriptional regulator/uracil phosphoribosyltransferase PyrR [Flavipsychrobacter sp.]
MKTLLNSKQLDITLQRLAHELIENHLDFSNTVIIGLQPRGIWLSDKLVSMLKNITKAKELKYGKLDITFYRDDVYQEGAKLIPSQTEINFSVENKKV